MWESTEVSERIFQAGCDLFPELKLSCLLKWEEFHDNPASGPKHSCVSRFFRHQHSPLLHLEGGLHFPSCSSHSVRAATQPAIDKPIGQQRCQCEKPIQFMQHIKGLKCSTVIWGRRLLVQSICQEDHTACYQINAGHMEDRGSGTTSKNKQGGVYQYYDKVMTLSVTTARNNQLDWITDD